MGRYRSMRKCEEIGEVAVMTTRARAAAHSVKAEAGRKRKVGSICEGELSRSSRPLLQRTPRRRLFVSTPPENSAENGGSTNSNDPYGSCCSSNGSIELENDSSKFVDLEEKEEKLGLGTSSSDFESRRDRRETTPSSSEVQIVSAEMESTARPPLSQANSHLQSANEKMPSEAELEEFFSAAEKTIHQQFAQKYNFDVSKDEPLEGRYEWVRVDP